MSQTNIYSLIISPVPDHHFQVVQMFARDGIDDINFLLQHGHPHLLRILYDNRTIDGSVIVEHNINTRLDVAAEFAYGVELDMFLEGPLITTRLQLDRLIDAGAVVSMNNLYQLINLMKDVRLLDTDFMSMFKMIMLEVRPNQTQVQQLARVVMQYGTLDVLEVLRQYWYKDSVHQQLSMSLAHFIAHLGLQCNQFEFNWLSE